MVDADVDIDPNRPRRVLAVAILFLCLTPIAVALRLYSKVFITRTVTSDDKLLCLLQAVFTVFLVTEILGVVHGTGRDATQITPEDRRKALQYRTAVLTSNVQYFFAGELLYLLTTILLKVCVGILLLRIAIVPTHVWILRALLLSTLVFGFLYLFLVAFQCRPVHVFWDEGPRTPGHCFSKTVVLGTTFTAATLNCIADWTFGILPLFIVWSLDLRKKTKILVVLLLGFASIASIATIIRAVTVPSVLSEGNFLRTSIDLPMHT
uniref:Integral membrane protein n=1 Tax=Colletotrichum fructicola (strain Nara gc5) TaxID=1213859 RepID=L2G1A4_COLFN